MSKRPDLLPPSYIQELAHLQDRVKPTNFSEMIKSFEGFQCTIGGMDKESTQTVTIDTSYINNFFDEFNTKPIASASNCPSL